MACVAIESDIFEDCGLIQQLVSEMVQTEPFLTFVNVVGERLGKQVGVGVTVSCNWLTAKLMLVLSVKLKVALLM